MSPLPFLLLLFLFSSTIATTSLHPISTTTSPTPSTSPAPKSSPNTPISLDPNQTRALQSLNIPSKDPCSPTHNSTTICDSSKPFRHLVSLTLANCFDDVELSLTALKSLSTLTSLNFINCPISPINFPSELALNLHSFTCISSLNKLTGEWLKRLGNLADLNVSKVIVNASGPSIILDSITRLQTFTLSQTNLTGFLPKNWHPNLTHVDLSSNQLKGKIPSSISVMENLLVLDLSSNSLEGEIPITIGDLASLQKLSLSSNSLSGSVPDSIIAMPDLVHLDLGSNKLNGTVPKFIQDFKKLKFLNLEKNSFHGVLPFNATFLKRLEVFKVGGNYNLCYNHSTIANVKVKLVGISPCDNHGMPIPSTPSKDSSSAADDDYSSDDEDWNKKQSSGHHGPSKVVLGLAIALSSIVFLIIFLVLLSKCCK